MYNIYKNLEKGTTSIFKAMFLLLFSPIIDLGRIIKREIFYNLKKNRIKALFIAIIPIFLLLSFYIYSIYGIYKDMYSYITTTKLDKDKQEIESFLKLYENKFEEHDCNFMKKTAIDEAMFDKGKTYKDYKCNEFYKIQKIKLFPLEIGEIKENGNKLHVRGKLIRIEIINGKSLVIAPIRFELWKTKDMDIWHWNQFYGESKNRWIKSVFKKH